MMSLLTMKKKVNNFSKKRKVALTVIALVLIVFFIPMAIEKVSGVDKQHLKNQSTAKAEEEYDDLDKYEFVLSILQSTVSEKIATITYDQKYHSYNFLPKEKGMITAINAISQGELEDEWDKVKEVYLKLYNKAHQLVKSNYTFNLLNPANKKKAILTIEKGKITYDFAKVKKKG
jgi:hypothetical protein